MSQDRFKDVPAGTWTIDEGIVDAPRFLRLLPNVLPEATHLCVEGTRIGSSALSIYQAHPAAEANPWPRQTWATSRRIVCRCSRTLFERLGLLSESRPVHELLDHMALFVNTQWLLEWHDAFANAILLPEFVSETTVAAIATPFGVRYSQTR